MAVESVESVVTVAVMEVVAHKAVVEAMSGLQLKQIFLLWLLVGWCDKCDRETLQKCRDQYNSLY